MLLLILFAGCLASCAAQTTSTSPFYTSAVETSTETVPYTQSVEAMSVLPTSDSDDDSGDDLENVMAILLAAVRSYQELNETDIAPVLTQFSNMIEQLQPHMNFSLTLKSITRV